MSKNSIIRLLDLELPKLYTYLVTDYEQTKDHIIIRSIDVYDSDNKFIAKADLSKVKLREYELKFVSK